MELVQDAAALAVLWKWQAADLTERVAVALARPTVADPAAHTVGILFWPETRLRKFIDHQLDRCRSCAARLIALWPPRRNRQVEIFSQIDRPDFKRGDK